MYPAPLVMPMKGELISVGFEDLTTPDQVDAVLGAKEGTVLVVVNSVCGCAAGAARPGVKLALEGSTHRPTRLATVFAGFDTEAVAQAVPYTAMTLPKNREVYSSVLTASRQQK